MVKLEDKIDDLKQHKGSLEEGYKIDELGMIIPDYDMTIKFFEDGDIVKGTVVRIDRDEVLVDVGYKSEGVIPLKELSIKSSAKPQDLIEIGQEIETLVLQKEDADGRLILSKKRADFEKSWDRIQEIHEKSEPITGTIIEVVKGGLILDVGVRGFLPASLVDMIRVKNLDQFVGQEVECKIIEMNRSRNNVVLSRRAVLEGEKKNEKNEIISKLERGQLVKGKVSSIVDFGAFVDLGGVDGLIHISELSWNHINHPSEIVSVGDEVSVLILEINPKNSRISLGYKQTQEDSWKTIVDRYNIGDIFEAKVIRTLPFGVFVEFGEGLEGLIHVSELSYKPVNDPKKFVNVGDSVEVKLLSVDVERRRISLSLKQVNEELKSEEPKAEEEVEEESKALEETASQEIIQEPVLETAEVTEEIAAPAKEEAKDEPVVELEPEAQEVESQAVKEDKEEVVEVEEPVVEEKIEETVEAEPVQTNEEAQAEETKEKAEEVTVEEEIGDPNSLEDVLAQMKKSHGSKK